MAERGYPDDPPRTRPITEAPILDDGQPGATVTLAFCDIEGSTRLLQALGDRYPAVLAEHNRLIREAFLEHGGVERGSAGDGLYFTFPTARGAVLAAVAAQRAVGGADWPDGVQVRDRIGLHTGEPLSASEGYVGLDVHRAARICAAGHGGQILISQTTRDLAASELTSPLGVIDIGVHRLKDLDAPQHLFQVVGPGLERHFPPPRTTEAPRNNLSLEVTTFIGREGELERAALALAQAPLVTLTGPGGVGKTRLGLRLARETLDRFDDGVWVVDLEGSTDGDFVVSTVAKVLGVGEAAGRSMLATVVDHLRVQRLLLMLDDCDHVLAACAELAEAILRTCPNVRLIATSREALGVPGEVILPVASLATPDAGHSADPEVVKATPACRLFIERATAVHPAFAVTAQNAPAIAQVCRRLDGIPLAIELAAARVRALPVEQIAARLDDRFRLLTGGARIAVARHQTLRATVDWSYDLLSEPERAVLRRLAVFSGGASLDAAEAVCEGDPVDRWDVLDILSRLVDKSLLLSDATTEDARFRMLETVREYAHERLVEAGEGETVPRRHRDWYAALVEEAAGAFFQGPEPGHWLRRLDREHDDLRAALEWNLSQPSEAGTALAMAAGLWRFWEIRGHVAEGRGWLERALEAVGDDVTPLHANALTGAGSLAFMQGDYRAAWRYHQESLALHRRLGDRQSIAYAANNLANTAVQLGDLAQARELYDQTLSIIRTTGDVRGVIFGTINLADVAAREGDIEQARGLYEQTLDGARELGDRWMEAFALDAFALTLRRAGDLATARALQVEALAILQELGDIRGVARLLTHLADVALADDDPTRARGLLRQGMAIRQELGDMPGLASAMESLAGAVADELPEAAARLMGAAGSLRESIRAVIPPQAAAAHDQALADLEAKLGSEPFEAALRAGRAMSPNEALATLPL